MLPSDLATEDADSLDEELRLFYVAVTRARRVLEINVPLRHYHDRPAGGDPHSFAQASRFLSDAVRVTMDTEAQLGVLGQSDDPAARDGAGGGQASGGRHRPSLRRTLVLTPFDAGRWYVLDGAPRPSADLTAGMTSFSSLPETSANPVRSPGALRTSTRVPRSLKPG